MSTSERNLSEDNAGDRLNELLRPAGLKALDGDTIRHFEEYLALILRWNARINLTSVRDSDEILVRHFVESIACAQALPDGIHTLLDFGSGAGFPGLPIALCRPEIVVTLAESQGKKSSFLREAVRVLHLPVGIHSGRAETLDGVFDCVTLRAVDQMPQAVAVATRLVKPAGWLALMTTGSQLLSLKAVAGTEFSWEAQVHLPGSEDRLVALGARQR